MRAALVIVAGVSLGACDPATLQMGFSAARTAASIAQDTICTLPENHYLRERIRANFGKAGYDSSHVCEEGWEALKIKGGDDGSQD